MAVGRRDEVNVTRCHSRRLIAGVMLVVMDKDHEEFIEVLQAQSYEALLIKRHGSSCSLVIRLHGEDHCFVNRFGKRPVYRHAWQIRTWLHEEFGIAPDSVPVEVYR